MRDLDPISPWAILIGQIETMLSLVASNVKCRVPDDDGMITGHQETREEERFHAEGLPSTKMDQLILTCPKTARQSHRCDPKSHAGLASQHLIDAAIRRSNAIGPLDRISKTCQPIHYIPLYTNESFIIALISIRITDRPNKLMFFLRRQANMNHQGTTLNVLVRFRAEQLHHLLLRSKKRKSSSYFKRPRMPGPKPGLACRLDPASWPNS